jgi:hypothetical protein
LYYFVFINVESASATNREYSLPIYELFLNLMKFWLR